MKAMFVSNKWHRKIKLFKSDVYSFLIVLYMVCTLMTQYPTFPFFEYAANKFRRNCSINCNEWIWNYQKYVWRRFITFDIKDAFK